MKRIYLCVITATLALNFVQARLDETLEECVQRYGPLIKTQGSSENPQFIFEKDGITVGINFVNGKAGQVTYSKKDRFLDLDIQRLLDSNAASSKWHYDAAETQRQRSPTVYSKQECFTRDDGGAVAQRLQVNRSQTEFLVVASTDYEKAIGAKRLPGF